MEETKLWLRDVKDFITEMIDTRINFCSLPDLVDTVNAMQIFFYSNFVYPDTSTKLSVDTSPKLFTDLQTGIASRKPISDVTVPKSFRTTLSGDAHEMHLGDDTVKSDSESGFSRWFI